LNLQLPRRGEAELTVLKQVVGDLLGGVERVEGALRA
jgi:hypothetical protein